MTVVIDLFDRDIRKLEELTDIEILNSEDAQDAIRIVIENA